MMKIAEEIKRYIKHYEHRFQEAQEQIKEDPEDWNPYLERRSAAAAVCALRWVLEGEEDEK